MTYLERQQYQDMRDRVVALRDRVQEPGRPDYLTRDEALELVELVSAAMERMSPERWDRALDAVAEEAARRADSRAARRQPGPVHAQ